MKPRDLALMLALVVVWAMTFIVAQFGLLSFPPLLLTGLRFSVAALPVFFVRPPQIALWRLLAVGATLFFMQFALQYIAMSRGIAPGLSAVVLQCHVLFTLVLAGVFLKDRMERRQIAGAVLAVAGLAFVAVTLGGDAPVSALVLVLLAGLGWATGSLLVRTAGDVDMFKLVIWASLVPPLPLFALSYIFEGPQRIGAALAHPNAAGLGAVLYLGIIATVGGYGLWSHLLRRYPASTVVPFSLLMPPISMVASALIFHEAFPPLRLAAIVLVLVGVVSIVWPTQASARNARAAEAL